MTNTLGSAIMSFSIMMWLRFSIDFKILKQSLETVRFASSSMLKSGTVIVAKVSLSDVAVSIHVPLPFAFLLYASYCQTWDSQHPCLEVLYSINACRFGYPHAVYTSSINAMWVCRVYVITNVCYACDREAWHWIIWLTIALYNPHIMCSRLRADLVLRRP